MAKPLMLMRVMDIGDSVKRANAAKAEIEKLGQFDVVVLSYAKDTPAPPHVTVHRADGLGG